MLTRIEPPDRKKKWDIDESGKKWDWKGNWNSLVGENGGIWRPDALSPGPLFSLPLSHSCSASLGGRRGLLGCMFLHTGGNGMYSIMYMRVLQRGAVWGMCAFKRESTFLHTFFFFVCPSIIMGLWDIWNDILSFSLPPFEKCLTDCNC